MPMQELRNIRAGWKKYANLRVFAVLVIEEQEPLSHFPRRVPNNGISVCVIGRRPVKDFHAQRTLLQQIRLTGKRVFNNVFEQAG